jgi:hypothetical protein
LYYEAVSRSNIGPWGYGGVWKVAFLPRKAGAQGLSNGGCRKLGFVE